MYILYGSLPLLLFFNRVFQLYFGLNQYLLASQSVLTRRPSDRIRTGAIAQSISHQVTFTIWSTQFFIHCRPFLGQSEITGKSRLFGKITHTLNIKISCMVFKPSCFFANHLYRNFLYLFSSVKSIYKCSKNILFVPFLETLIQNSISEIAAINR